MSTGELRQDLITGKWVAIAKNRGARPGDFAKKSSEIRAENLPKYKDDCPFCNLGRFPQEPDVLRLPDDPQKWQVHIFGNKYPAFTPQKEFRSWQDGPYKAVEAAGYHELLATRYHNHTDSHTPLRLLTLQFEALQTRYQQLRQQESVSYIQIIKNHGAEAGGSLEHPHHQIFTTPVLPSDISDLLQGAENYASANNANPFDTIITHERSDGRRLVAENDHFLAFCPYASRQPFEVWIMPLRAEADFGNITAAERTSLAEMVQTVTSKLYTGLEAPPYNYYIYSAPCDTAGYVCDAKQFQNFRWHLVILPRFNKLGGFEISTGLEIVTAIPEESAAYLREQPLPKAVA